MTQRHDLRQAARRFLDRARAGDPTIGTDDITDALLASGDLPDLDDAEAAAFNPCTAGPLADPEGFDS